MHGKGTQGCVLFRTPENSFRLRQPRKDQTASARLSLPLMSLSHMVVQQLGGAKGIFSPIALTFSPIQP